MASGAASALRLHACSPLRLCRYKSYDDITTQNDATETFFRPDGSLQADKVKALARTYARAVAGTPTAMAFNPTSATFELNFTAAAAPATCGEDSGFVTEVFLQLGYHYPSGYGASALVDGAPVDVNGDGVGVGMVVAETGDHPVVGEWAVLAFTVDPGIVPAGARVTLRVSRKNWW